MSVEKVTKTVNRCVCQLPDCPGKGKPWLSKTERVPDRCAYCLRRTWNGTDLRKNTWITAHNKTQRLSEWAKETGISSQLIRHRLKIGWSEFAAVSIPPESGKKDTPHADD